MYKFSYKDNECIVKSSEETGWGQIILEMNYPIPKSQNNLMAHNLSI